MKVIFKFDLDNDESDDLHNLKHFYKSIDYCMALLDINEELRRLNKSDFDKNTNDVIENLRARFFEILYDRNIDINDM